MRLTETEIANIPALLKSIPAWCMWKGTKRPYHALTDKPIGANDPDNGVEFEDALATLEALPDVYEGLGFILSDRDNIGFIDLDDPSGIEDQEKRKHHLEAITRIWNEAPDTYTEISPSGKGAHILVQCDTRPDCIKKELELYTKDRFMTVTGRAVPGRSLELAHANDWVDHLFREYANPTGKASNGFRDIEQFFKPETMTDEQVIETAGGYRNGGKFLSLYQGNWQSFGPSQSEADMSLVNMIKFVTQAPAQIKRIFLASQLGQRSKAHQKPNPRTGRDYVDQMIFMAFDNEVPEVVIGDLRKQHKAFIETEQKQQSTLDLERTGTVSKPKKVDPLATPVTDDALMSIAREMELDDDPDPDPPSGGGAPPPENALVEVRDENLYPVSPPTLDYSDYNGVKPVKDGGPVFTTIHNIKTPQNPIGIAGELGEYLYGNSPRPIAAVAISTALVIMAGICGRTFTINGTGLNIYTTLVAGTGIGKSAISNGTSNLFRLANEHERAKDCDFSKFKAGEFSHSSALRRILVSKPCCFSIWGELGKTIKEITREKPDVNKEALAKLLLDLTQRSGPGNCLDPLDLAKKDDSYAGVESPGFSFLGETTGETLYPAISSGMVSDGFISRLVMVPYEGYDVALRKKKDWVGINPDMLERFVDLLLRCYKDNQDPVTFTEVEMTPEVEKMFDKLEYDCTVKKNRAKYLKKTGHTGVETANRELWGRVHLNAMRIAALIACGMPFVDDKPLITMDAARWAIEMVVSNTEHLLELFDNDKIGVSDTDAKESQQMTKAMEIIRLYLKHTSDDDFLKKNGGASIAMAQDYCIPHSFFYRRLSRMSCIEHDRRAAPAVIRDIISTLIDEGLLRKVEKQEMMEKYGSNATGYRVIDITAFISGQ